MTEPPLSKKSEVLVFALPFFQCLFDPNKGKKEESDLSVFNPLSQDETVSFCILRKPHIVFSVLGNWEPLELLTVCHLVVFQGKE